MGGGFTDCDGQDIIDLLNGTFGDPRDQKYITAKGLNPFGNIQNKKDNYRDLVMAYWTVGIDVSATWFAYLKDDLGKDPKDIFEIAKARDHALKNNLPMTTSTHKKSDGSHGGKHVMKHDGSNEDDPTTINSPFCD